MTSRLTDWLSPLRMIMKTYSDDVMVFLRHFIRRDECDKVV